MGEIPKAELVQRLQTALTPFPADSFQKRVFAQAVARLDTPDPELLPFYQQFLQAGVEEPLLHYRIAQIQVQRGDFAAARQAIAAYEQTGIGQEDIGGRLLLLADIDRREGKTEESFQRYEQLLNEPSASRSDRTAALQGMTRIRRIQGRLPEIVALYDRVIESDPQDTAKPLGQASVAYQADLISEEEAEAILNEWLANRSEFDNPVELFSLVSALPANSQREALYRRLVVVDPSYMPVQLRLLQVLAEQNPEEAEQKAAELIARDPDNIGAYFVQGQLAETLGNLDQASQAYEQVVQRSMNDTDALAALGGVRFQQAQYRSAIQLYNQVLELEPENRVAQIALAELSTTEGRRLEAIEDLEELQRQQETDGQTDADLDRRIQRIREGFLQQRGFQPPWERY
jgi:tetratricopeptide (TPR) repeat protein